MSSNGAITKGERMELAKVVRMRAKVAKNGIDQRRAKLMADVEEQLTAEYKSNHEGWQQVVKEAEQAVRTANEHIAERCNALGVREEFRPSLSLGWYPRGENLIAKRRAELRKVAISRLDALSRDAKVEIDRWAADVATQLIAGGLESSKAHAFLDDMTAIDELMPAIDLPELGDGGGNAS